MIKKSDFKTENLTNELAYEIAVLLAQIHSHSTDGVGDLTQMDNLSQDPSSHFTIKFEEGIAECKNHLPVSLIEKCRAYFKSNIKLLTSVDGPCIIHRDFRPANMIVDNNELQGIFDWSSGRASFAEDDFCPIEHGEWPGFDSYKKSFLAGYASIRPIPDYGAIMPLLRLNRALAVIGFTVKHDTWKNINARPYKFNRKFLNDFCFA